MESQVKLKKLINLSSMSMSLLLIVYLILMTISLDTYFNIEIFVLIITSYISHILLIRHINKNYSYLLKVKDVAQSKE